MSKRARVAIVRGTSLNPWEARSFQLLGENFDTFGVTSLGNPYDLSRTTLAIKRLFCPGEILGPVPGGTQLLYSLFGSPQILSGLEETIAGCDLVESAEITNYYTYQAVSAKKKGLVGIVGLTVWENIPFNQEQSPRARENAEFVIENADFFIAGTRSSREAMLVRGVAREKIVDTIAMSEDTDFFRPRKQRREKEEFIFLCASRLVWEKGVQDVLFALELVAKKYRNIKLWVVGKGNYKATLLDLAERLELKSQMLFKEQIPYFELPGLYTAVDAFILPSVPSPLWKEQFGMTIVQAMACGIPVIGSTSGSIPELIGRAGLIYPAGNVEKLAQGMMKLIEDTSLYNKLREEGRKRVKKFFEYRVVAEKRSRLYRRLLR